MADDEKMPKWLSRLIAKVMMHFVDYEQRNDKSNADKDHDIATSILNVFASVLRQVFPEHWKHCLWIEINPQDATFRYWAGTMTEQEFQKAIMVRVAKYVSDEAFVKEISRLKGIKPEGINLG